MNTSERIDNIRDLLRHDLSDKHPVWELILSLENDILDRVYEAKWEATHAKRNRHDW